MSDEPHPVYLDTYWYASFACSQLDKFFEQTAHIKAAVEELRKVREENRRLKDIIAEVKTDKTYGRLLPPISIDGRSSGVYFIQSENALIKIGMTGHFAQRFNTLRTSAPVDIWLVGFVHSGDCCATEDDYHSRFGPARVRGEWFLPINELLECIEGLRQ